MLGFGVVDADGLNPISFRARLQAKPDRNEQVKVFLPKSWMPRTVVGRIEEVWHEAEGERRFLCRDILCIRLVPCEH